MEQLQSAGHEALFVGGFVRDWLLGIDHFDVDVATSATPDRIAALFEKTEAVGAHFGVTLVMMDRIAIEVATFRAEGEYSDFRRPDEVRFAALEEDALRRDFTINALYYDPVAGRLRDFHAGALDLRRRVLRTVGQPVKRLHEDALRLMRAVRFAAAYELEVEPRTRSAIRNKARLLEKISRERVGEELLRILTGPRPGRGVHLMSDLGLWRWVIPEIEELKNVEQGELHHPEGDAFVHTALALDHLPPDPPPALALAALLHDIGKPATFTRDRDRIHFYGHQKVGAEMARRICRGLKYGNDLTEQVTDLVEHHMAFIHVQEMRPAKLKRFLSRPDFELHLELHRADAMASSGDLTAYEYCLEHRRRMAVEHGEAMKPEPLATGDDLIALGLKPGPRFKELLEAVQDEQWEGRVKTREEAMDYLRGEIGKEHGLTQADTD